MNALCCDSDLLLIESCAATLHFANKFESELEFVSISSISFVRFATCFLFRIV